MAREQCNMQASRHTQ